MSKTVVVKIKIKIFDFSRSNNVEKKTLSHKKHPLQYFFFQNDGGAMSNYNFLFLRHIVFIANITKSLWIL